MEDFETELRTAEQEEYNRPQLMDFNKDLPNHSPFILVCGKRGSGKSVWTEWLLKHYHSQKRFWRTILISGSHEFQKIEDHFPMIQKGYRYNREEMNGVLQNVMEIQKNIAKTNRDKLKPILIVLDDCMALPNQDGKQFKNHTVLSDLSVRGRHLKISVVILLQSCVGGANKTIRNNSDVIVSWPSSSMAEQKFYLDSFAYYGEEVSVTTRKKGYVFFNRIWQNEPFTAVAMLAWKIGTSHRMQDFVKLTKAPAKVPKFKMHEY